MNIGRRHCISTDEAMVDIDTDTVLVAIIVDPVLFDPAGIQVLLPQSIWVFIPALRQAPGFDLLVLLAGIALLLLRRSPRLGDRDKSCVDDLPTTGLETLRAQV